MTQTPDGDVYLVRTADQNRWTLAWLKTSTQVHVRSFNGQFAAKHPGSHGPGWNLVAGGCAAAQESASAGTTVTLDVPELPGT